MTVNTPLIGVTGNGQLVANNAVTTSSSNATAFGTAQIGANPVVETFTINNAGTVPLTLGSATIGGVNAGDFVILSQPATSVSGGASTTFIVEFVPLATGSRTASISFTDNDPTQTSPYTFAVSGQAVYPPQISVTGGGNPIADGASTPTVVNGTDLGPSTLGVTVQQTYAISNSGTGNLNLGRRCWWAQMRVISRSSTSLRPRSPPVHRPQ